MRTCCAPSHLRAEPDVSLHAVALEYFLTCGAEPGPVLLQTLLHRVVVAELLAAKPRGVAGAGALLLRSSRATLGKGCRGAGDEQGYQKEHVSHVEFPLHKLPPAVPACAGDNSGNSGMFPQAS